MVMHHRAMKLGFISALAIALAVLGLVACGGLAQDINKGAGTTEREINSELGHDRTTRDAGQAADAAEAGTISM
jgi:hypothetical protein